MFLCMLNRIGQFNWLRGNQPRSEDKKCMESSDFYSVIVVYIVGGAGPRVTLVNMPSSESHLGSARNLEHWRPSP